MTAFNLIQQWYKR